MPQIRAATEPDLPAILEITNEAVRNTTAIWYNTEFTLEARTQWWRDRAAQNHPVLVAESASTVIGFGTYAQFRPHEGYRKTMEHSLYVTPAAHRQGAGAALLAALLDHAQSAGIHAMIGGIDATNHPSLALHRRFGFSETGRLPQVGRKFGRWLDLVFMQKILG